MRVDADEPGLTVVQVIAALADVEIHDAYRVDLLHVAVLLTPVDVLRDGLRRPEEETLHEIQLAGVLDLYDDYLALAPGCSRSRGSPLSVFSHRGTP